MCTILLPTLVGTIIIPTFSCVLFCGTGVVFPPYMGRGRPRTYPPGIVPTRPLGTLGFVACGNIRDEIVSCKYIGLTCW